jgi:hypothetical protein
MPGHLLQQIMGQPKSEFADSVAHPKKINLSRFSHASRHIRHSFYLAAYFENGLTANRPTKKFCEIAAVLVSPSYCTELVRGFLARRRCVRGIPVVPLFDAQVEELECRILR